MQQELKVAAAGRAVLFKYCVSVDILDILFGARGTQYTLPNRGQYCNTFCRKRNKYEQLDFELLVCTDEQFVQILSVSV